MKKFFWGFLCIALVGGGFFLFQNKNNSQAVPCDVSLTPEGTPRVEPGIVGKLLFTSRCDGRDQFYVMDPDGTNVVRLTNAQFQINYPNWSPDGSKIVFEGHEDGAAIFVMNADGTSIQRLSPTPSYDGAPSWSPDGSKIVFVKILNPPPSSQLKTQMMVMNIDGTDRRELLPPDDFYYLEPRFSPDGSKIAFMSNKAGSGKIDIYVMNADGSNIKQLTHDGNNGDPVWSPDGSKISFGSDREGGGKVNIFVINPDGSNLQQLTHVPAPYEAGDTSWSPDGTKIAFEWDIGGKGQSDVHAYAEVWIMNADGTDQRSTGQRCSGVGCAPRWKPVQ